MLLLLARTSAQKPRVSRQILASVMSGGVARKGGKDHCCTTESEAKEFPKAKV